MRGSGDALCTEHSNDKLIMVIAYEVIITGTVMARFVIKADIVSRYHSLFSSHSAPAVLHHQLPGAEYFTHRIKLSQWKDTV